MTSMARKKLKAMNEPTESEPPATIRAPTSSTPACASSGMKERSGT